MRLFIAIELPKEIISALHEYAKQLKKMYDFEGTITREEHMHLTLKFLGEVKDDKVPEIIKRLKSLKSKSMKVRITDTGVFTPSSIRILWIKLDGADKLQAEIDRALEPLFKKEARFMSHITIARVKSMKNKDEFLRKLRSLRFPGNNFEIKEFKLKKSTLTPDGPIYEDVKTLSLRN